MVRRKFAVPFSWRVLPLASLAIAVLLAGYCQGQVKLKDAPAKVPAGKAVGKTVESRSVQVGKAFPNFELKDQDGQTFSLKTTLKKGPVVLVVYRSADW